jgi:hypothetical protein
MLSIVPQVLSIVPQVLKRRRTRFISMISLALVTDLFMLENEIERRALIHTQGRELIFKLTGSAAFVAIARAGGDPTGIPEQATAAGRG